MAGNLSLDYCVFVHLRRSNSRIFITDKNADPDACSRAMGSICRRTGGRLPTGTIQENALSYSCIFIIRGGNLFFGVGR